MRSFWTMGMSFVAGSAMMVLGSTGTAGAQDAAAVADAAGRARAAQVNADEAQTRADDLAKQGGWAYKSGLIDRTTQEADRYQDKANAARDEITGANVAPSAVSPTMAKAEERLQTLEASGGWAYKSGAVRREEAHIDALKGPSKYTEAASDQVSPTSWADKPVIQQTQERTSK
jgi:hypothetical protein